MVEVSHRGRGDKGKGGNTITRRGKYCSVAECCSAYCRWSSCCRSSVGTCTIHMDKCVRACLGRRCRTTIASTLLGRILSKVVFSNILCISKSPQGACLFFLSPCSGGCTALRWPCRIRCPPFVLQPHQRRRTTSPFHNRRMGKARRLARGLHMCCRKSGSSRLASTSPKALF